MSQPTQAEIELKNAQETHQQLYKEYVALLGEKTIYAPSTTLTLSEIKTLQTTLQSEITQEKMMLQLEKEFTKGAEHYLPKSSNPPFNPKNLTPIVINKGNDYKTELKRISQIYLSNSKNFDSSLQTFNNLSKNYFSNAAASIKEIFDLKSDSTNKLLERIPKLGIIPKILRVSEQIRLAKCVIKDFNDVNEKYVSKSMIPYIKEFENQYKTIVNYIETHSFKSKIHNQFTKNCLEKVEEVNTERKDTSIKLLDSFSIGGSNINQTCDKVKKNGIKEVAMKAVFMIMPLF